MPPDSETQAVPTTEGNRHMLRESNAASTARVADRPAMKTGFSDHGAAAVHQATEPAEPADHSHDIPVSGLNQHMVIGRGPDDVVLPPKAEAEGKERRLAQRRQPDVPRLDPRVDTTVERRRGDRRTNEEPSQAGSPAAAGELPERRVAQRRVNLQGSATPERRTAPADRRSINQIVGSSNVLIR